MTYVCHGWYRGVSWDCCCHLNYPIARITCYVSRNVHAARGFFHDICVTLAMSTTSIYILSKTWISFATLWKSQKNVFKNIQNFSLFYILKLINAIFNFNSSLFWSYVYNILRLQYFDFVFSSVWPWQNRNIHWDSLSWQTFFFYSVSECQASSLHKTKISTFIEENNCLCI